MAISQIRDKEARGRRLCFAFP